MPAVPANLQQLSYRIFTRKYGLALQSSALNALSLFFQEHPLRDATALSGVLDHIASLAVAQCLFQV